MSQKLQMVRDINGYVTFGLPICFDNWGGFLAPDVEQNFIVPSNYSVWSINFSFSPGSSVWVAYNQTAVLPTGTFGKVNCELNPATRLVYAGDTISLLTNDATKDWVGVNLYALQ